MITPPYLKNDDLVALVATAKNFKPEDIQPAIQLLEGWGLRVVLGKNVYNHFHQFAGTDEERLEDLQMFLDDKEVRAIFCIRGGYGTSRIIDQIKFARFRKHPKWVVGFSDITLLLNHLNRFKIESLHAIMPILFKDEGTEKSLKSLKDTLWGKSLKYSIKPHQLNRIGESEGRIVGGNLSILNTTVGTKSDFKSKGRILFIEDLDEYLYHLDRMMIHLKRAGKLENLSGLIVGHFSKMKDNPTPFGKTFQEIILDAVKEYDFPVCFNFPVGHEPLNLSMICGRKATINVSEAKVELKFED